MSLTRKEMLFLLVSEECGEISQAASKCIRFTAEHSHYETSNLERLNVELGDLFSVLHLLEKELSYKFDPTFNEAKLHRIEEYMKISTQMGTLS